jgi:hypothetical protein
MKQPFFLIGCDEETAPVNQQGDRHEGDLGHNGNFSPSLTKHSREYLISDLRADIFNDSDSHTASFKTKGRVNNLFLDELTACWDLHWVMSSSEL